MLKQKILTLFMVIAILTTNIYADDTNIDGGGGGGGGIGTAQNMWAVRGKNGGLLYDAEGFRIYLVNSDTGAPASGTVDISNHNVAETNMRNGGRKTKHDYRYNDGSFITITDYYKELITSPTPRLPNIIPWNEGNSGARINAIKEWFLEKANADWCFSQLGYTADEVRERGLLLGIEPVAYFRYNGFDYALTPTEVALLNQMSGGDLRNKMGPLTHKNHPLSIFLEQSEFIGSSTPVIAWTGSRTDTATDIDIINHLGIGYIYFAPKEEEPPDEDGDGDEITLPPTPPTSDIGFGSMDETFDIFDGDPHTYPIDTWVITSFRLCNVRENAYGNWDGGAPLTSMRPTSATITVEGITSVTIPEIYIPRGGEQVVWVKWKTPPTPGVVAVTANAPRGLFPVPGGYSPVGRVNAKIVDTLKETPPPDPTIDDIPSKFGYDVNSGTSEKSRIISAGVSSNSWIVWDCHYELWGTSSQTNVSSSRFEFPVAEEYNEETGLWTVNRVDRTYTVSNPASTTFYVAYTSYIHNYIFTPIEHRAQLMSTDIAVSPSEHVPTAETRFYETYMKSGYGINLETEAFVRVTTNGSSTSYYDPTTTSFVAAPQFIVTWFPEFNYRSFNRFLEKIGKWEFKQNIYSTYFDRSHFTPWWFPDNYRYNLATRIDFAYTPAGRLYMGQESTGIMIDGNLYDDWRIAPVKVN
ncbi:MAG: hypothetical protein FWH05_01095 [Oscillospiraceae bacterium]|nr:hypothetical protein [Oscillospiraceae bacterium]